MEYGFERIEDQEFNELLDEKYPSTGSRMTVEHEGKVYRRRFYPLQKL